MLCPQNRAARSNTRASALTAPRLVRLPPLLPLLMFPVQLIPEGGLPVYGDTPAPVMPTITGQEPVCRVYTDMGTVVTLPHCMDNVMQCRTDPFLKAIGKACVAADPRFVPQYPQYLDRNGNGALGPMTQVWFPSEEWPSGTGHEWDGPDGVPIDPP
jgi:hypothetical protein